MKKQLDPRAIWFFSFAYMGGFITMGMGGFMFGLLLVALPYFFENSVVVPELTPVVLLIIGFGLSFPFSFIWATLTYQNYYYELTDAGFRKELGVISKKYVTIPYDRIQNVDIYRSILARLLGLSDLNIQTAGTGVAGRSGAEGRLPGLSQEVAEQLRDELIQRARQSKNQGL